MADKNIIRDEKGRFVKGIIPKNKKNLDEKRIINLYTQKNKTIYKIAKKFNVSSGTIFKRLKNNGINTSLKKINKGLDKKKIIRLFIEDKKNIREIGEIFNVDKSRIWRILKENNVSTSRKGRPMSKSHLNNLINFNKSRKNKTYEELYGIERAREIKGKLKQLMIKRKERFGCINPPIVREKLKKKRKNQILPIKDTSIEVKIQNFLKQLGIEYFTHQYVKIEHGYQCDILIPSMNLVIECDGDYWHKYPIGNDIDHIRTKELLQKGFKVLRLWEFEIKNMGINDFKERLK